MKTTVKPEDGAMRVSVDANIYAFDPSSETWHVTTATYPNLCDTLCNLSRLAVGAIAFVRAYPWDFAESVHKAFGPNWSTKRCEQCLDAEHRQIGG